ncbi:MAG TPA: lysophospholipid acyltransferase family protein [Ktedonobacterales bacterium]
MKEYKTFYETCRAIVAVVVALLIRLRVAGLQHLPKEGPVILISNHLNWTDVPTVAFRYKRRVHYMAKAELFQKAPLKWLVIGLGAFPVRRGEADRQAIKQAEEVLKAGQVLVIFPEGTRSKTRVMKEGLPGAALIALRSGAPVVPVGIYGSEKFKLWHIWPFRTQITITYGEPFTLSREGKRAHTDLQMQLDVMMRHIAELLPPQYQGKYALSGEVASPAQIQTGGTVAPAAQLQPGDEQEATEDVAAETQATGGSAE